MWGMWDELQETLTTTPAPSEIGRLARLVKAARVATYRSPLGHGELGGAIRSEATEDCGIVIATIESYL